jgi:hypothetical protein
VRSTRTPDTAGACRALGVTDRRVRVPRQGAVLVAFVAAIVGFRVVGLSAAVVAEILITAFLVSAIWRDRARGGRAIILMAAVSIVALGLFVISDYFLSGWTSYAVTLVGIALAVTGFWIVRRSPRPDEAGTEGFTPA